MKDTPVKKQTKVIVPPINFLFKLLQQQSMSSIWLYEQTESKINGRIRGFDEFMNVVVEDAVEVNSKTKEERKLGRILLKGDNITLISSLES